MVEVCRVKHNIQKYHVSSNHVHCMGADVMAAMLLLRGSIFMSLAKTCYQCCPIGSFSGENTEPEAAADGETCSLKWLLPLP